jgi:integrase
MGRGPHLYRRGAVYHWQRRLPSRFASHLRIPIFRLSLNTKHVEIARRLVPPLDAYAAEVFMTAVPEMLTKEQLQELFKGVLREHQAKLGLLADLERQSPTAPREELLRLELAQGEAYRLLAEQGADAQLNLAKQQQLFDQGRDRECIVEIIKHLEALREDDGSIKLSLTKLKAHIEKVAGVANAANVARAQPIYLRALGEALLQAGKRYGAEPDLGLDFDALIEEASNSQDTYRPSNLSAGTVPVAVEPILPDQVVDTPGGEITALAATLQLKQIQDKSWDDKTARQARFIYTLFARFMEEEFQVTALAKVEQAHLSRFDAFLRALHSNFGKSSRDPYRSIAEIRKLAVDNAEKFGVLSGVTRNRHWMFLGQLLGYGRGQGGKVDRDLSTSAFHAPKNVRGRNQRPIPAEADVGRLFHLPVFTGYAAWDDIDTAGSDFYHRAEYFCPIIAHYSGARREEICGLQINDVVVDNGDHPYLHISWTDVRRIKNEQSQRNIALHPEIIRLGFLDYVDTLRGLGHTLVFPDLFSPSTKSPMGDRLYDQLLPSFREVGFTTHQIRHFFGDELKQMDVHAEHRADLLGHGGDSETTERYCNPLRIEKQLEHILKMPVLTAHLETRPVRLIPWVEAKEIAPWSKAAKLARKEEQLAARAASGKPPRRRHKRRKPK